MGQGEPSSWGALQLGSAARVRWSSALELQNRAEGELGSTSAQRGLDEPVCLVKRKKVLWGSEV